MLNSVLALRRHWPIALLSFALLVATIVFESSRAALAQTHTFEAPASRSGSAAAPFGPANSIGDFDHDGRPDVVLADRVSASRARTRYRVEVALSNGRLQRIFLSSVNEALHVAVVDVDRDGDQDIVFTRVLSPEIAAILANDGSGRFDEHPVDAKSVRRLPEAQIEWTAPAPGDHDAAAENGAQKISGAGLPSRLPAPLPSKTLRREASSHRTYRARLDFSLISRPPPVSTSVV